MADETEQEDAVEEPVPRSTSLLRRQWLFLRQNWWDTGPLTPGQRLGFFLRGFFLVVVGCIGLAFSVAGTLGSKGSGLDAVGKLVAEFMLIPIGLLALIVVGLGCSLVVRSVIGGSHAAHGVEEP
jgi:hypothetical protein